MLLSDAARTGRKFRRTSEPKAWYWLEGQLVFKSDGASRESVYLNAEQLIATDWEAEPLQMMLEAADIIRAAREHDQLASTRRLTATEFAKLICQSLGLLEEE